MPKKIMLKDQTITKKRITQLFTIILLLISCFILLAIYINIRITNKSKKYWITNIKQAPNVKAALVLGAKVFKGGILSHILKDRVDMGIELYKLGKVDKLLLSGDHGLDHYDETNSMKEYALKKGVPARDIFLDHAGFRTYDSLFRAKEVFNLSSLIVVTQEFHLARAIYTARELGLKAFGIPSDKRIYLKHRFNKVREFFARVKAYLELHLFRHNPRFLGPKINISADGRLTHD